MQEWAKNTGRYHEEYDTQPNYAHLKTRLRCAINKAPDIVEVESLTNMRAFEPYKVYRLLDKQGEHLKLMCANHNSVI